MLLLKYPKELEDSINQHTLKLNQTRPNSNLTGATSAGVTVSIELIQWLDIVKRCVQYSQIAASRSNVLNRASPYRHARTTTRIHTVPSSPVRPTPPAQSEPQHQQQPSQQPRHVNRSIDADFIASLRSSDTTWDKDNNKGHHYDQTIPRTQSVEPATLPDIIKAAAARKSRHNSDPVYKPPAAPQRRRSRSNYKNQESFDWNDYLYPNPTEQQMGHNSDPFSPRRRRTTGGYNDNILSHTLGLTNKPYTSPHGRKRSAGYGVNADINYTYNESQNNGATNQVNSIDERAVGGGGGGSLAFAISPGYSKRRSIVTNEFRSTQSDLPVISRISRSRSAERWQDAAKRRGGGGLDIANTKTQYSTYNTKDNDNTIDVYEQAGGDGGVALHITSTLLPPRRSRYYTAGRAYNNTRTIGSDIRLSSTSDQSTRRRSSAPLRVRNEAFFQKSTSDAQIFIPSPLSSNEYKAASGHNYESNTNAHILRSPKWQRSDRGAWAADFTASSSAGASSEHDNHVHTTSSNKYDTIDNYHFQQQHTYDRGNPSTSQSHADVTGSSTGHSYDPSDQDILTTKVYPPTSATPSLASTHTSSSTSTGHSTRHNYDTNLIGSEGGDKQSFRLNKLNEIREIIAYISDEPPSSLALKNIKGVNTVETYDDSLDTDEDIVLVRALPDYNSTLNDSFFSDDSSHNYTDARSSPPRSPTLNKQQPVDSNTHTSHTAHTTHNKTGTTGNSSSALNPNYSAAVPLSPTRVHFTEDIKPSPATAAHITTNSLYENNNNRSNDNNNNMFYTDSTTNAYLSHDNYDDQDANIDYTNTATTTNTATKSTDNNKHATTKGTAAAGGGTTAVSVVIDERSKEVGEEEEGLYSDSKSAITFHGFMERDYSTYDLLDRQASLELDDDDDSEEQKEGTDDVNVAENNMKQEVGAHVAHLAPFPTTSVPIKTTCSRPTTPKASSVSATKPTDPFFIATDQCKAPSPSYIIHKPLVSSLSEDNTHVSYDSVKSIPKSPSSPTRPDRAIYPLSSAVRSQSNSPARVPLPLPPQPINQGSDRPPHLEPLINPYTANIIAQNLSPYRSPTRRVGSTPVYTATLPHAGGKQLSSSRAMSSYIIQSQTPTHTQVDPKPSTDDHQNYDRNPREVVDNDEEEGEDERKGQNYDPDESSLYDHEIDMINELLRKHAKK